MKKLVTIAKSKFYMIKVSYPDVVQQVMTDMAEFETHDAEENATTAQAGGEADQDS